MSLLENQSTRTIVFLSEGLQVATVGFDDQIPYGGFEMSERLFLPAVATILLDGIFGGPGPHESPRPEEIHSHATLKRGSSCRSCDFHGAWVLVLTVS